MSEIVEFLLARITEDEREANVCLAHYVENAATATSKRRWTRVLAECEAKRAIIKQHEEWPILIEGELKMSPTGSDPQSMAYHVSKQISWLTEREYVKRFGDEPPAAPMIRILATVYADHPDYREEWKQA